MICNDITYIQVEIFFIHDKNLTKKSNINMCTNIMLLFSGSYLFIYTNILCPTSTNFSMYLTNATSIRINIEYTILVYSHIKNTAYYYTR